MLKSREIMDVRQEFAAARCLVTGGAGFIGSNLARAGDQKTPES